MHTYQSAPAAIPHIIIITIIISPLLHTLTRSEGGQPQVNKRLLRPTLNISLLLYTKADETLFPLK